MSETGLSLPRTTLFRRLRAVGMEFEPRLRSAGPRGNDTTGYRGGGTEASAFQQRCRPRAG